jgi:hypothetical protein
MGSLRSHIRDIIREYDSIEDYLKTQNVDKKGFSRCSEETPKYNWTTTTTMDRIEDKTSDLITEAVVDDLRSRSKVGIKKYNTTLYQNNKDDYMNHLYEELLDAAQYIKKEMSFVPMIKQMMEDCPNDIELGKKIRETFNG